jgi:hypothetical protein
VTIKLDNLDAVDLAELTQFEIESIAGRDSSWFEALAVNLGNSLAAQALKIEKLSQQISASDVSKRS